MFVIPYFYPAWQYGGTPRAAFELARGLVGRGHSVQVLTTDSGGERRLPNVDCRQKCTVEGIGVYYYRNISNALAYHHRIFWPSTFLRGVRDRIANTDVLHIHELRSMTSVFAARAALDARVPYAISAHGGFPHLGKRLSKTAFDAFLGKRLVENARVVIAASPVEQDDARRFGVEAGRVRLLPNAINVADYSNLPRRDTFRSRWSLGPRDIVLFLGRLHWVKGADILLEAFRHVINKESNVRLVLAGPDDGQESELRRRVDAMKLNAAVTFTGFLDETQKREALAGSDVVVVPSRSEVFALTAIEGLLSGTPVIMSSACGLHPLPPGRDCDLVQFHTENPADLASKLLGILAPDSIRHNVAAARDFVSREFSADAIASKAELIYAEMLERHGKD